MLSLGTGDFPHGSTVQAYAGLRPYTPSAIGTIFDLMFCSQADFADHYSEMLIGSERFLRVTASLDQVIPLDDVPSSLEKLPALAQAQAEATLNRFRALFNSDALRDRTRDAGFREMRWFDDINWESLFASCNTVDAFFTSNTHWTASQIDRIKRFLSKTENCLTVVIRNPDLESLAGLAARFLEDTRRRFEKILETAKTLLTAYDQIPLEKRGTLRLLTHSRDATHTYYRFGNTVLFVPYRLRPDWAPGEVPVLFFNTAGSFFKDFLEKYFAHLSGISTGAEPFTRERLERLEKELGGRSQSA